MSVSGSETPPVSRVGPSTGTATPSSQPGTSNFRPATPTRTASNLRNELASPTSPGSDYESQSMTDGFAPSILASKLGRSLNQLAAESTFSLTGSGYSSPSLTLTGFNAISTVLNNPSKRQHPIDPKSSRYPPVTPTPHVLSEIPKIKKTDIEGYLTTVRPEWDRFMRNQYLGRQGKARVGEEQEEQDSQGVSSQGTPIRDQRGSVASLSADLRAQPAPPPQKNLPPLSSVPQIFFAEQFDLGNPYTFDQVTERYSATGASNGGKEAANDVALNQSLQDKLSYYSDVVEQHLIIEIGQQSSSFFTALGNLKELDAEAQSCLSKIKELKKELDQIDQGQAKKGLRIVQEQERRRQLQSKHKVVESVKQVVEQRDLIQLLVQQGETEEALEMIQALRTVLSGSPPGDAEASKEHIRFADLESLSSILPQLSEMEASLSGSLQQDLLAILAEDIAERIGQAASKDLKAEQEAKGDYFAVPSSLNVQQATNVLSPCGSTAPPKTPLSPYGNSAQPLYSADEQLRARIVPLIGGLARTGGMDEAAAAYREVALRAIRDVWRSTVGQDDDQMAELASYLETEDPSKDEDHDGSTLPVVSKFRDASHDAFLFLGRRLFDSLLERLRIVDSQSKLMLRILDEYHQASLGEQEVSDNAESNERSTVPLPPTMPTGVSPTLPAIMANVVVACAELSHVLSARLLSIRFSTHTSMELAPFLSVFQLCWSYVLSSEVVCRKMIVGLRGSILSQAKGFLSTFHRKRIEKAAKAVEEETWAQSDVGAAIQREVKRVVDSAVEDPPEFVITGDGKAPASHNADAQQGEKTKTLEIEDRSFSVVGASLEVLELLGDYLRVIINLPLLTTEAMGRVVEFLKQFNSRTCQVVLGAGAMRSAGLKNITAKHLALASQSLSIMISLIPYIRETVRRHISPKQAVMLTEFDKLRRDFQEHQFEIHAKLVAIMSDRLTVHCRTLNNIEWNAPASKDEETIEANKYASDLVKETATLHKVLSKYLQVPIVEHVIGQVLKAIDVRISAELNKIEVQSQTARDRMVKDVTFLEKKLSLLKNVEWKGEEITAVIERKKVPPPASVSSSTPSSPHTEQPTHPPAYKPRIPSLFARRQQQQAATARSSVDSGTSVVPATRGSTDSTPRSSMQEIATPPVLPNKDATSANEATSGTEDEPPSLPSKSPQATTESLTKESSEAAPAAATPQSEQPQPVQPEEVEANVVEEKSEIAATTGEAALPAETQPEHRPEVITVKTEVKPADEDNASASADPAAVQLEDKPEAPTQMASAPTPAPVPTPAPTTAADAPTRTSIPANGTCTPSASPVGTPSRPGRMSLKERLAEAARKRMMAQQVAPSVSALPTAPAIGEKQEPDRAADDASGTAVAPAEPLQESSSAVLTAEDKASVPTNDQPAEVTAEASTEPEPEQKDEPSDMAEKPAAEAADTRCVEEDSVPQTAETKVGLDESSTENEQAAWETHPAQVEAAAESIETPLAAPVEEVKQEDSKTTLAEPIELAAEADDTPVASGTATPDVEESVKGDDEDEPEVRAATSVPATPSKMGAGKKRNKKNKRKR